jgi:hypothetical protein
VDAGGGRGVTDKQPQAVAAQGTEAGQHPDLIPTPILFTIHAHRSNAALEV